jgi:hypothetical protein
MANRNTGRKTKSAVPASMGTRHVKRIRQYSTKKINYPTDEEISEIVVVQETWKTGDRLYKYAKKYYNDERFWWLIAWFNKKPTENHFSPGDKVKIIFNINEAVRLYNA